MSYIKLDNETRIEIGKKYFISTRENNTEHHYRGKVIGGDENNLTLHNGKEIDFTRVSPFGEGERIRFIRRHVPIKDITHIQSLDDAI